MKLDEIIANPYLYPSKERNKEKQEVGNQINKFDHLLKEDFIENKVINRQSNQKIKNSQNQQKQQDIYSLLYGNKIGDKMIDQDLKLKLIEDIQQIPYVIDYIEKQENLQFKLQTQLNQTEMVKAFEKKKHTLEVFQETQISKQQVEFFEQNKGICITSIACFENMIAFGTSKASTYISINNHINQLEQNKKIISSPIICLSFADRGKKIIAITEQQVLLFTRNKFINAFQLNIEGKPISMTACQNSENFKLQFLITDSLGNIHYIGIKKTLIKYKIQFIMQIKENNICYHIETIVFQEQEYIILTFKDYIQIISLKPEYELLIKLNYRVQDNKFIQTRSQVEKQILKLAVSNENLFEVLQIQFERKQDGLKQNLTLLCQNNFINENIEFLTWLSNDIIFIKHERKRFSLISITEIQQQTIELYNKQLSVDVKNQKIGDKDFYNNSICNYQNFLFYVSGEQKQKIIYYKLNTWEDFIQQFYQNGELKEQFGIGLYLYSGNQMKLGNLPRIGRQEYMKPYLHNQILKFVESSVKSQQSNSIFIAMEYLITIESYDFLFNQIYQLYKNNRFEKQFYQCLESFIRQGVIKQISIDLLQDLLLYFCQEDKIKLLKLLISNLDKRYINQAIVNDFFIRFNLQSLLIYIPSQEIEDYKVPLLTLCKIYKAILNNNQNDLQGYFKSIQVELKTLSHQQREEEIQSLGYKCIWQMSLILKGQQFLQEKIPDKYLPQIIYDILNWLLEGEILEMFLNIDAGIFLNEFLILFKDNKKYVQLQKFENELRGELQKELTLCEIILIRMEATAKKMNVVNYFNCFIYELMKLGYQISYEHFLQVMTYNFRNPYQNLQVFVQKSNYKYKKVEYQIIHDISNQDKIKRDNLLIQYITYFSHKFVNDEISLQAILSEASSSILSCSRIQSEIYCLKREWMKCLETILSSTVSNDKEYIFNFIDRFLNSSVFINQRDDILKYSLSIVQQLADISVEKLKSLLQYFSKDIYQQAIDKLDNHPNFKLSLLYQIIEEKRKKNQIIENQIMISYFKLLCRYHPDEVYEQLQYGDFPLEECIKICKEFKIMKGIAYLKERCGCLQEALDIYCDLISTDFIMNETKASQSQLDTELQMLILPCLKICRENNQNQDDNLQLWFTCIQRMLKIRQESYQQKSKFKLIKKILYEVLVEVLERVHPRLIINNLNQLVKNFIYIEELRITTQTLQKLCLFQLITYEQYIGNQMYRNLEKLEELYYKELKGMYPDERCLICKQENEQYMYAFQSCNHILHKQCLKKIKNVKVCQFCLDKGIRSDGLKLQIEIIVDNNNFEQQSDIQFKQTTLTEQQELSKQEKRMFQINKWKMHDIEKEVNNFFY